MRSAWMLLLCVLACMPLPVLAQEKSQPSAGNAALEKELFALELKWMKAEFDKKMTGPDSMGELWTDEFFDVLPGGRVVNKQDRSSRSEFPTVVRQDHETTLGFHIPSTQSFKIENNEGRLNARELARCVPFLWILPNRVQPDTLTGR